jgi:MFS family permease
MATGNHSAISDMLDSFKYIRRETIFLFIVIFGLFHIVGVSSYLQLTPVFTESILKVDATKLGLLNSISSAASFLCSIIIASVHVKKRGLLTIISSLVVSLAVIVFAYSQWWYLSLVAVFVCGCGTAIYSISTLALVQTYAEPDYRARTMGLLYMGMALGGLTAFFSGAFSEVIGLQLAVAGTGGILFVVSAVFLVFAKRLRSLE